MTARLLSFAPIRVAHWTRRREGGNHPPCWEGGVGDGELDGPQGTAVAHGCAPQGPGGKVEERPREAASGLLELGARQPPPRLTLGVQQAHGFRGGGCPAAAEENRRG